MNEYGDEVIIKDIEIPFLSLTVFFIKAILALALASALIAIVPALAIAIFSGFLEGFNSV